MSGRHHWLPNTCSHQTPSRPSANGTALPFSWSVSEREGNGWPPRMGAAFTNEGSDLQKARHTAWRHAHVWSVEESQPGGGWCIIRLLQRHSLKVSTSPWLQTRSTFPVDGYSSGLPATHWLPPGPRKNPMTGPSRGSLFDSSIAGRLGNELTPTVLLPKPLAITTPSSGMQIHESHDSYNPVSSICAP